MKTFNCWLIANFEIVMILLTAIVGSIAFFGYSGMENERAFRIYIAMGGMFLLIFPTNRGTLQLGRYIVMLGGVIFYMWYAKEHGALTNDVTHKAIITWFWWIFSIASVISVILAIYTFINFDEVTSRRMLWGNSDVMLFEISLLYTLDRFCNITVSIVACTGSLVMLFKLI